jgi:general stress protein 26
MTDAGTERQRVRALIERAGVTMLMNVDERGTHVGRPMLPLFVQSDPHIYFLTHQSSRKVTQLAIHPQVALSIISTNCFIVVAGSAELSRDPELIRRLWNPTYRAWFPRARVIAKQPSFASQSTGSTTGNRRAIESSGWCRPSKRL